MADRVKRDRRGDMHRIAASNQVLIGNRAREQGQRITHLECLDGRPIALEVGNRLKVLALCDSLLLAQ